MTDEALDWFIRLRDDDTAETLAAFEQWRANDPRHLEAYDQLLRMHAMPSLRKATVRDAERLGLAPGRHPIPMPLSMPRRRSRRHSIVGAMAAMLLVAVGWHEFPSLALQWRSDYRTAVGQRQTVTLPDGSVAVLNTSSALAIDFADGRRRIALLDGEAFFDVRHDASRPFVVTGGFSSVEVKGTAFAVLTDGTEDVVTLARGRVDVTRNGDAAGSATLEPGQMIVANASGLSPIRNADIDEALAWRDGRIVFHDRPFGRALESLERYYGGAVVTMAGDLDARRVSGNYRTDEPEAAIRTLARSAGLSVTRLPGGTLILR